MQLVILGSGTANPHPLRSSAGFWLETDAGLVMLDFAASALHRLAQERLDWGNIDAIWLSHFHLDHCCGLPAYLFGARHAKQTESRTKPLRIIGGPGLRKLIADFDNVAKGKLLQQRFLVELIEIEHLERFELLPGLEAIAISTPHTDESHAIRIEDNSGKVFVYTSDTGFGKEIAAFSKGADMLVIESSFVKDKRSEKHLELAEVMYLIGKARPKRAVLTHLYVEWDEVDFKTEIAKFGPVCEVIEARDGLRLTI